MGYAAVKGFKESKSKRYKIMTALSTNVSRKSTQIGADTVKVRSTTKDDDSEKFDLITIYNVGFTMCLSMWRCEIYGSVHRNVFGVTQGQKLDLGKRYQYSRGSCVN